MGNVHGGDRQIFQLGNGGVQAIAQGHGSSRASRVRQQFAGFFANLVIQRHGRQKRNERVPIILPALFIARVLQRLAGKVFRDRGITNKNFVPRGDHPFAEVKIPAFALHEQRGINEDSHFARSVAARLAAISLAVSASKGERER